MNEHIWLADQFEANRNHIRSVAFRMLGSMSEADDAVQESWLRLSRSDAGEIRNLGGWLTTVVARVCLDMLRSRESRREESLSDATPEPIAEANPEQEAIMADSVGLALLVVLETLSPAERLAFVLHDMFAVPFDAIAPLVGRTPTAARQLASRARRRVQGTGTPAISEADQARQREIVSAFLAASRNGDFEALVSMLAPDVVLRADSEAVRMGVEELQGAAKVAGTFSGRAQVAQLALIDGYAGAVWSQRGQPRVVFGFHITNGVIVEVELLADSDYLSEIDLKILSD